jgi:hypothetical protein
VPPHDRQDDNFLIDRLLRRPGRSARTELFHQRSERFRPTRVAQHDLVAEGQNMPGDGLRNGARADDADFHTGSPVGSWAWAGAG